MKVELKVKKEFNLTTLKVKARVRYWEDSEINGVKSNEDGINTPCKEGDLWIPEIDIDSGKINNWMMGVKADIHYKVCDCCGWELCDESGVVILSEEDGYVPDTLCPKDIGDGDYIIMDIDENGQIADWNFNINNFIEEYK